MGFLWTISDMINGNEEKDRKPNQSFIHEINKYPGLLEVIFSIEGLVTSRGQHASGIILYNDTPFETNAFMRSPNGDLTTQFDLHQSELLGDVKFDFLITEICDKELTCINLLKKDGYFSKEDDLRTIYNKILHPEVINLEDKEVWDSINSNSILDLFQFDSPVGRQGISQIHPKNIQEMLMTNALIRLVGEKGKERPIERYVRMKENLQNWYNEMQSRGLSDERIKILEPHYLKYYGTPTTQESLMLICMDDKIAGFSLKEANAARKVVSKKNVEEVPKLKESFISACGDKNFGEYVWETCMEPQMSYAFAVPHATCYSIIGYQVAFLATKFPRVYWNCACLTINSGGGDFENEVDDDFEEEEEEDSDIIEDNEEEDSKKKKKHRAIKFGKIATAIGKMRENGIIVSPPDINESTYTFSPNAKEGIIRYGLSGISKINNDLVKQIVDYRPYNSIDDFLNKIKITKPQMINLIKSGAFDSLGDRIIMMNKYISSISETKQKLTLQNMRMLIDYNMLPNEDFNFAIRVYNFNKYLKALAKTDNNKVDYIFDDRAFEFYSKYFDLDEVQFVDGMKSIKQKTWDKIYKKEMNCIRDYLKENQNEILHSLNQKIISEIWDKYAAGSVSKWEMDSVSFYSHPHELAAIDNDKYNFDSFYDLPEEPEIDHIIEIKGKEIPIFKLSRIAGTVLDKDKNKGTVTLLTIYGVVTARIWKNQFVKYNKQISEKLPDGRKKIIEKSWFSRGNKLAIVGIRRGDSFIPKIYKNSKWSEPINLIKSIDDFGDIEFQTDRIGEE